MPTRNLHQYSGETGNKKPISFQRVSADSEFEHPIYQIDLLETPADETLLDWFDADKLLGLNIIPWRKFGQRMVYLTGSIEAANTPKPPDGVMFTNLVSADPKLIRQYLESHMAGELLETARNLCPEKHSCRNFHIDLLNPRLIASLALFILAIFLFPTVGFLGLLVWLTVANLATTLLRFSAILSWRKDNKLPYWLPESSSRISAHRRLMKVSILVPLFREDAVLPRLIESLELLDYPRESFEVKFLLEEVDTQTADSISKLKLPNFIQCITVPKDWLQTKPKAMNFALPHCNGEIIGIYDAEDRPDADQILKVVDHFLAAPANVACLQGYLDFYNSRSNWLSRCFTIEYATWFRVIMKGIQNIGLPIPLGGTTVFFRRRILEEIGGWDAHNVTEDADLGMRLARYGYRCEMVNTTTWEEANNVPFAWIRQRSRWLKGFAMTWASHMRDPAALFRDLGPLGFLSFHIILLGALNSFLAAPIFWALWLAHFSIPIIEVDVIPTAVWWVFTTIMVIGQIVMLSAIILAIKRKHLRHLAPYILMLPLYWPLGMLASYKALAELFFAPFYWDKTYHGRNDED